MRLTLVKKSEGIGRISARDLTEDEVLRFCKEALEKKLWMASWMNEKGVRLVTVSGAWPEIESLYESSIK